MKLAYLKVKNHNIFGTFEINFKDQAGIPYDTIILAGENGTGKSTLLNIIFECFYFYPRSEHSTLFLSYEVILNESEKKAIVSHTPLSHLVRNGIKDNALHFTKDLSIINKWEQIQCEIQDDNDKWISLSAHSFYENMSYTTGALFSEVAINFNSKTISSVTTRELDRVTEQLKRSDERLATDITQLLVDISSADANDLQSWVLENDGKPIPDALKMPRMKRFMNAFEQMFPDKKFFKIGISKNGGKSVEFKEGGKIIELQEFSSGEKQIVFRGGFFLKDIQLDSGKAVIIDEPEISLHPRWQIKILDFYKNLFVDENGIQRSQLFVATHSPFIIHNEARVNDKVFVLQKSIDGSFSIINNDAKFFDWRKEKSIKEAFKIDLTHKFEKNVSFVEGELDEMYNNKAIELFNRTLKFEVKWIGRKNQAGQGEHTGEEALKTTKKFLIAHPGVITSKVLLLFDNDCNQKDEDFDKLKIRSAPKDFQNSVFTVGIESLIILPDDFNKDDFIKETIKPNGRGGEVIIKEFDKTKFCNWIIDHSEAKRALSRIDALLLELNKEF